MKRNTHRLSCTRLQLALIASGLSSCAPLGETVELGVYQRASSPDAAASGETIDASTPDGISEPDAASATPHVDVTSPTDGSATPPAREPQPPCAAYGCISSVPVLYDDPALQCQRLVAHDVADAQAPYAVPDSGHHYVRFTLKASNAAIFYLRSVRALIGDKRALHHMRLYESHGELPEGISFGATTPTSLRLLYSWAPGVEPLYLDPSVGLELGANTHYTLEVHYVTGNGVSAVSDESGFELCASAAAPEYRVSVTRIGPMPVIGSAASTVCAPTVPAPVQLLAVYPQVDPRGRHVMLATEGWSPPTPALYDADVDYELSDLQPLANVQMTPGGSLLASCVYDPSGEITPDEQCSVYVLHWPAHTLSILSDVIRPDVCP